MQLQYLKDCENQDEAKKLYRKLARKLHPDVGGDPEAFKLLVAEWEWWQNDETPDDWDLDSIEDLNARFIDSIENGLVDPKAPIKLRFTSSSRYMTFWACDDTYSWMFETTIEEKQSYRDRTFIGPDGLRYIILTVAEFIKLYNRARGIDTNGQSNPSQCDENIRSKRPAAVRGTPN